MHKTDIDSMLPALLRDQAAARAEALAVVHGAEEVVYSALEQMVTTLAAALVDAGVRPRAMVGVCLARSVWSISALLAIWRVGGVYVPMDPAFPAERLSAMAQEAAVGHAVVDEVGAQALGDSVARGIRIDRLAGPARDVAAFEPHARDLAYVVFTSGSAGRPKAVAVEHGAVAYHAAAMLERFAITADDRVLAFSSFSFDASLDQLLPALLAGAAMVVRPDEPWLPFRLPAIVEQNRISVVNLPPSYWAEMTATLPPQPASALSGLRLLILGGEAVAAAPLAAWRAAVPWATVLNMYGPTESVVDATAFEFVPGEQFDRVLIGRQLAGRVAYVLDGAGSPVPEGAAGELYVGGSCLARGYLGRPAQTASRFVADPFGPPGSRMYRTGDRVRLLPGGDLEFLGRVDDQVKIRGHRIEPAEVESVLGSHTAVAACAVVAVEEGSTAHLACFLVPTTGELPSSSALRAHAMQSLPEYMVPNEFLVLDALPVTPTGKLDRAVLKAYVADRIESDAEFVAPRDELEAAIAQIWSEVLKIDRVGVYDNFFDLGGHSLLATRVVHRLRVLTGIKLNLNVLFQAPTVAALKESVVRIQAAGR